MKKVILLALALTASPAFATPVCVGGSTAADKSVTASKFISSDFTQKCSANVFLDFDVTDTAVAVAAASVKGKNVFAGTSEGGAVAPVGACAANPCAQTDSAKASSDAAGKLSGGGGTDTGGGGTDTGGGT